MLVSWSGKLSLAVFMLYMNIERASSQTASKFSTQLTNKLLSFFLFYIYSLRLFSGDPRLSPTTLLENLNEDILKKSKALAHFTPGPSG